MGLVMERMELESMQVAETRCEKYCELDSSIVISMLIACAECECDSGREVRIGV